MGDIGFRKKGDSGPLYNPERDYAYITPTLMLTAIENLEAPKDEFPADAAWRNAQGITTEELGLAAEALARAQRDFVNSADPVTSLMQALSRHGFYDIRPAVRNLLFASIGEVFCAAWFKAVREVSTVGEESPAGGDMARFSSAVRAFARRNNAPVFDDSYAADALRMYNDVLQTRLNVVYKEHKELQEKFDRLSKEKTPVKPDLQVTKTLIDYITSFIKKAR